jgi:hypothetical protein
MIMRPPVERVHSLNDLMDSIPEEIVLQFQSGAEELSTTETDDMANKNISKSQRIRDYLDDHPAAKGREILAALSQYGVKQSDIGNVKSKMKRDGVTTKSASASTSKATPVSSGAAPFGISFKALEAGTAFLKEAGSLNNAKELLTIIDQIRSA